MAGRRRGGGIGDMVRTLLIFVVAIVALVAFLPRSRQSAVAQPVQYAVSLAALRSAAPFPVYAPVRPPVGWTANHITTHVPTAADGSTSLDLGFYLDASKQYAAVEQSDAAGFVATQLGARRVRTGTTTVAGVGWQTWTDSARHPALVRTVGSSTLVLDGSASAATIDTLAAALSLQPAS